MADEVMIYGVHDGQRRYVGPVILSRIGQKGLSSILLVESHFLKPN